MMAKKLIVQNPRNIPAGVQILSSPDGTEHWYEGDTFTAPTKAPAKWPNLLGDVIGWTKDGYLKEVSDG